MGSITPLDVRRIVETMNEQLAPATVRTNLAVLAAVLNAAVEADLIGRSPVRGIKLASERPSAKGTLSLEDLVRLAEEVPGRFRARSSWRGWSGCVGRRRSA